METVFLNKSAKRTVLYGTSSFSIVPSGSYSHFYDLYPFKYEKNNDIRHRHGRCSVILPLCHVPRVVRGSLHRKNTGLSWPVLSGKEVRAITEKPEH